MSKSKQTVPISEPIDDTTPLLSKADKAFYITGAGCIGWLAQTGRPDVAHLFSRLSAHLATPTASAKKVLLAGLAYLAQNSDWAICQHSNQPPLLVLNGVSIQMLILLATLNPKTSAAVGMAWLVSSVPLLLSGGPTGPACVFRILR